MKGKGKRTPPPTPPPDRVGGGGGSKKEKQFWQQINFLARSYLQIQVTRVGLGLRLLGMEDQKLIDEGLLLVEITKTVNATTGDISVGRKKKLIDKSKETKQKVKESIEDIKQSQPYVVLQEHHRKLYQQEKSLLKEAVELAEGSALVDFCKSVRGFGDVAALTFLGYINPLRMKRIPRMNAAFGLTPDSRLKKGVQAKFNPKTKGRFWMVTRNVIMAKDPYYTPFYQMKKQYLSKRPDLLFDREKKKKGWKAKINGMGYRWFIKLLLSNAWEMVYLTYTKKDWQNSPNYRPHNPRIPPKPLEVQEWKGVHQKFDAMCKNLLHELNSRWPSKEEMNTEEGKIKLRAYYEFLRNAKV